MGKEESPDTKEQHSG